MAVNETLIAKHMKTLGISREEALQLIADDEAVDRITSTKQIDSDLTEEQRKSAKGARQADRKPTVYKFDTSKRKRAENSGKRFLIDALKTALEGAECEQIDVTNPEREIVFYSDGVKYKIVLSAPRS